MDDIDIRKYGKHELAHQHLFLMDTVLPDFLESIVPLDKYHRVIKDKNDVTCYECDVHLLTEPNLSGTSSLSREP